MNDLRRIYSKLADKESKDIFECRLLYSITGRIEFIDQIISKYTFSSGYNELGVLEYLLWGVEDYKESYPIVVYGCGDFGAKIFKELGDKIYCFCDSNAEKQKNGFCGKKSNIFGRINCKERRVPCYHWHYGLLF